MREPWRVSLHELAPLVSRGRLVLLLVLLVLLHGCHGLGHLLHQLCLHAHQVLHGGWWRW